MDQDYFQDVIAMATISVQRHKKGAERNDGIPR